jgi:hypothetical protein
MIKETISMRLPRRYAPRNHSLMNGFPLEFTPYLIQGGNDNKSLSCYSEVVLPSINPLILSLSKDGRTTVKISII